MQIHGLMQEPARGAKTVHTAPPPSPPPPPPHTHIHVLTDGTNPGTFPVHLYSYLAVSYKLITVISIINVM